MSKRGDTELGEWLRPEYGDDPWWAASFDSDRDSYDVRYVRDAVQTEPTDLDGIVHRPMAVSARDTIGGVYAHLREAQSLVVEHDDATAVHVYRAEVREVVVDVQAGASVTVPATRERLA